MRKHEIRTSQAALAFKCPSLRDYRFDTDWSSVITSAPLVQSRAPVFVHLPKTKKKIPYELRRVLILSKDHIKHPLLTPFLCMFFFPNLSICDDRTDDFVRVFVRVYVQVIVGCEDMLISYRPVYLLYADVCPLLRRLSQKSRQSITSSEVNKWVSMKICNHILKFIHKTLSIYRSVYYNSRIKCVWASILYLRIIVII